MPRVLQNKNEHSSSLKKEKINIIRVSIRKYRNKKFHEQKLACNKFHDRKQFHGEKKHCKGFTKGKINMQQVSSRKNENTTGFLETFIKIH